jgi:phosphatidylserine decarboxylase
MDSVIAKESRKPLPDRTLGERLNFLLTNRIPRHGLTRFMGWFSKSENPSIRWLSIAAWKLFVDDLRLFESEKTEFTSLHDCFTRKLKAGARAIDANPDVLCSPCDAVVGEFGDLHGLTAIQAKGFPYSLTDLLGDDERAARYHDGRFITLRLKSSMYHHFHAPIDCNVREVTYVSGDTWNVNPIALKSVERLFCKNERAVIDLCTDDPAFEVTLVPVAAILVASMRIRGLNEPLHLDYRGPNRLPCELSLKKGDPMGHFEHGSTILLFTSRRYRFSESVVQGSIIRMGESLMQRLP